MAQPVIHRHRPDEPCTPACPSGVLYVPAELGDINLTFLDVPLPQPGTATVDLLDGHADLTDAVAAARDYAAEPTGCTDACSEAHTFVPPCEQAISPGVVTDTVYRLLHQARENLCRAQTVLPVVAWRAMLGEAIRHIDYVGSRECAEQWSRFDRTDEDHSARHRGPVPADVFGSDLPVDPVAEPVWSLRRIRETLWESSSGSVPFMDALRHLRWHVEYDEAEQRTTVADVQPDGCLWCGGICRGGPHPGDSSWRATAVDVDVTNETLTMHVHGIEGGPPYDLSPAEARHLAADLTTAAAMRDALSQP